MMGRRMSWCKIKKCSHEKIILVKIYPSILSSSSPFGGDRGGPDRRKVKKMKP